jgi:hypothetical protein
LLSEEEKASFQNKYETEIRYYIGKVYWCSWKNE